MALTPERIDELAEYHGLDFTVYEPFARAIESEVRKDDEAELEAIKSDLNDYMAAANAEANLATELLEQRTQDTALILQLVEALCECAEDSQEQLDRMEAARLRDYKPNAVAWQEDTIAKAKAAITAGRARLEDTWTLKL